MSILSLAKERLNVSNEVEELAEILEQQGIHAMDAIHLALASMAKADFFVTCDKDFLRKAKRFSHLSCQCVSILDLLSEVMV